MSILEKIYNIQANVGSIPKNGVGPATKGAYAFIKNDDVLAAIRKQLIDQKVIVQVKTLEHNVNAREAGNRTVVNTNVLVSYTYYDVEDGSSFENIVGGEGSDIGSDTATRKAYTMSQKINNIQVFNIVTGDEIDPDAAEPMPEHKPAEQVAAAPKQTPAQTVAAEMKAISVDFIQSGKYDSAAVNALAAKVTGKDKANTWTIPDIKKLRKALEAGEVA